MKIEFDKIITNAVSSMVTMVFIGACLIVWRGATTVDKKVEEATVALKEQANYTETAVKILEEEMTAMKKRHNEIMDVLQTIKDNTNIPTVEQMSPPPLFMIDNSTLQYPEKFEQQSPDFIQQRLPETKTLDRIKGKY